MKTHWQRTLLFLLVVAVAFVPAANAAEYHFSGTIATGPQYDLYTIHLMANEVAVADTHCAAPPNNTLDTILTAYAPGVDPSDTANATFYNDDGGADICGGFHNSHLEFAATVEGDWVFRVDGFGSAVGDYTLDIVTSPNVVSVPTLDTVGLALLFLMLGGAALFVLRRQRRA